MTEAERIADEFARAHAGDPWHGSSTRTVIAGLSATEAAARPIPNAHTIWEIVLHMTGWRREVARRMQGGVPALPAGGDWPAMPARPAEAEWRRALDELDAAHREVSDAVAALELNRLDEQVGGDRSREVGTGVSWYVMLHGLSQHDAYHTGQIALLRKFTGS